MFTFILVAHIVIALVLVVVVLLQQGKGGGLGAGFGGGGANTLFGSSGGSNFFTKLTMCLAAAFMLTSLGLTVIRSKSLRTSIFDQSSAANGTTQQVAPGSAAPTPATATATEAADKAISPGAAPIAAPKK